MGTYKNSVKRNATNSPLLRLPTELRLKIWEYALGGQIVAIHRPVELTEGKVIFGPDSANKGKAIAFVGFPALWRTLCHRTRECTVPSAFHLPEVCRQIYCETSSLAYSSTTFFFCGMFAPDAMEDLNCYTRFSDFGDWAKGLIPAHRNAITDVKLFSLCISKMLRPVYHDYGKGSQLLEFFPSLERLHCQHLNPARDLYIFRGLGTGPIGSKALVDLLKSRKKTTVV